MVSFNNKKDSANGVGRVMKKGMAEIDIRQFISAFAVLVTACIIPYAVRIVDIFILVMKGIGSQDKRGSYSFEEILSQDFNQPMNLAYVMFANYLLYIVVFGLWYYHWNKQHICIHYSVRRRAKRTKPESENDSPGGTETANAISNPETAGPDESSNQPVGASWLRQLGYTLLSLFKTPVPYLLILAGYSGQVMVDSVLNIFRNIFPEAFEEYDALVSGTVGPTSSAVMLIAVFVLAPIGEEFLFRGLIQGKLAKAVNDSPMPAIILLQALLFAIYHGNLIQGIYAFFLGSILGLITHRADSLLPCIIFHMALNSSVCLVSETWFEETGTCVITGLISLVVFVPSVVAALKMLRKRKIFSC